MAIRNTTRRWGVLAQSLHWLIAVFILAQFTLAWLFDDLPAGAKKLTLLARHKSIGITILMLALRTAGVALGQPYAYFAGHAQAIRTQSCEIHARAAVRAAARRSPDRLADVLRAWASR